MNTTEAIETFINGNISDAKKALQNTARRVIIEKLRVNFGYSAKKAHLTAEFLKGRATFQSACDAE